jgi:HSP20 family protein
MGFFEKLKKGVGIEDEVETEKPTRKRERKIEKITPTEEEEKKSSSVKNTTDKKEWFEPEGQLAIDVFQTDGEIFIQSAIAGVNVGNLDITIENDVVTIKGNREKPVDEASLPKDYFYQECYWGLFSRQVILPAEVDGSRAEASMKEGILTIKIPKIDKEKKRKILVKE